jgi:hypothetical protein
VTPRSRYWSRHMRPKLVGGTLIFMGLLVLLVTQLILPGFSRIGWGVGIGLVVLGGLMLLEG